jgi:hypothetical protein
MMHTYHPKWQVPTFNCDYHKVPLCWTFLAPVVVHLLPGSTMIRLAAFYNSAYWLDPPWPDDAYRIWIVLL